MPITVQVADHPAKAWKGSKVTSQHGLLTDACSSKTQQLVYSSISKSNRSDFSEAKKAIEENRKVVQCSFSPSSFTTSHIQSSPNGFVHAVIQAYCRHHHLILRPDDIWFAILSQLSVYINANSEKLRDKFVDHKGKKELEIVYGGGSIRSLDFAVFSRHMTALIQRNVKDPSLRDWIMPTFSTTNIEDRATAAIIMMATMQAYFSYACRMLCGIPSVTLLGTRNDWEDIFQRLDKLEGLGHEALTFAQVLRPVLRGFIKTFDQGAREEVKDFWGRVAHRNSGGSGPTYLSGWITAFCFWDSDGKCLHSANGTLQRRAQSNDPESANVGDGAQSKSAGLDLASVVYHTIEIKDVPFGYASVPVQVNDNGTVYNTKMLAGSLGFVVKSNGDGTKEDRGLKENPADSKSEGNAIEGKDLDTLQPLSGWFMYLDANEDADGTKE